jgi:glycerol uptake facilitator-like aquaporin
MVAQIVGCCAGALIAHMMFELPAWQMSTHFRTGAGQWLAEAVAAYWFTASTSFPNPAITIARPLTNTFSGIRPADTPAFIAAQCVGALTALALARILFPIDKATGALNV